MQNFVGSCFLYTSVLVVFRLTGGGRCLLVCIVVKNVIGDVNMFKNIFVAAVVAVFGLGGTGAWAGFDAENPRDLMCNPSYANYLVSGIYEPRNTSAVIEAARAAGEFQVWLYTPEFRVVQDANANNGHRWIGVNNTGAVKVRAVMDFASMTYTRTASTVVNGTPVSSTVVSTCYKR